MRSSEFVIVRERLRECHYSYYSHPISPRLGGRYKCTASHYMLGQCPCEHMRLTYAYVMASHTHGHLVRFSRDVVLSF